MSVRAVARQRITRDSENLERIAEVSLQLADHRDVGVVPGPDFEDQELEPREICVLPRDVVGQPKGAMRDVEVRILRQSPRDHLGHSRSA